MTIALDRSSGEIQITESRRGEDVPVTRPALYALLVPLMQAALYLKALHRDDPEIVADIEALMDAYVRMLPPELGPLYETLRPIMAMVDLVYRHGLDGDVDD